MKIYNFPMAKRNIFSLPELAKKSLELPLLVTWTPSASKTSSSSDRWQDSCDLDSFTALATWEGLTLCSRSWRYLIVICYTYLYHKFIETIEIWQKWLYLTDDVDHHHYNRCWSKWLTPSPSSSPSASGAICCFSACSSLIAWVLKSIKTWKCTIWCLKKMKKKNNGPLTTSATASTIGNIMAVVAVLEIHMERNIVVNMKPNIKRAWTQGKLLCWD